MYLKAVALEVYLYPIHVYCIYTRLLSLKFKKLLDMEGDTVPVFHFLQPVAELQKNQRGEIGHHHVAATSCYLA